MRFQVSGSRTDCEAATTVHEHLEHHLLKNIDGVRDKVAAAIHELQEYNFKLIKPHIQILSVKIGDPLPGGAAGEKVEKHHLDAMNKACEKEFDIDMKIWADMKRKYEIGMIVFYGIIMQDYMSKALVAHVQSLENFQSEICNKPIKLLQTILTSRITKENKDPYMVLLETLSNFINMKQADGEKLHDFTKRVYHQKDVLISYFGEDFLDTFIKGTKEYKDKKDIQKQQDLKTAALDKMMGRYHLRNADRSKYGSLMQDIAQDFLLGQHNHPKSIPAATAVLKQHKWDATYQKKKDKEKSNNNRNKDKDKDKDSATQDSGGDCSQ